MSSRCHEPHTVMLVLSAALCALLLVPPARGEDRTAGRTLKVCAHPDNLPFSAQDETGFDNRIARLLAADLGARVEYTWFEPQRGLVRKTLKAGVCDALFGLPEHFEGALTTRAYYQSRYVFMFRHGAHAFTSFDDPALRTARVGVQIVGDDMAATPPGHALVASGAQHVIGFPVYGDGPAVARMAAAIARGEIDAGVAWGPPAAFFAARQRTPLDVAPAHAPPALSFLPFEFALAIGVRREDRALRDALDAAIARRASDIERILTGYHVPLLERPAQAARR